MSVITNARNYLAQKDFENYHNVERAGQGRKQHRGPIFANLKDVSFESINFLVSDIPIAAQCAGLLTAGYGVMKFIIGGRDLNVGKGRGSSKWMSSGIKNVLTGIATALPIPLLGKIVNGVLLAKDGIDILNHAIPCNQPKE